MEKHVTVLGVLNIVLSGVGVLGGLATFMVLAGTGYLARLAEGGADGLMAMGILSAVGFFILIGVAVMSVPGIIIGWGLLKHYQWARILAIVFAVIGLFGFPVGTAVGIYSLWVLFNDEVVVLFGGKPAAPVETRVEPADKIAPPESETGAG